MNDQSSNSREVIDSWYEQVISSCNHHDSDQAYSAWRKWDEMISLVSPEQKSEVMNLQEELTYTAFPSFPQDIAASLVEKHLVSFLRSPVDIDEMIQNRFLYLGYGFEEDDRQALRGGALKNQEPVGGRSVAEWLGALDTALASAENPENVMTQFFTQDPAIASMSRLDQAILRRLFQVYYDFFAFPVVTVYGLAETARKLSELEKSGVKEINVTEFFAPDRTAPQDFASDIPQGVSSNRQSSSTLSGNESLPLLKALGKFEKLGGQQVTNSKIVVKGQNDPVRPTIFNWLRAYRDELGVGAHDAVTRGQFLFHSRNGKGLSSDERDQVGMLLKSLDENMPLTIDAGRQEVVFREQGARNKEQGAGGREQGTGGREQGTARTAVTPLAVRQPAEYAVRGQNIENSGRTPQKGERPMFANTGNISRAVFDLPHVSQQITNNREQGTGNGEQRTGSKEQGAGNKYQISNTKYQIQNPPAVSAIRHLAEADPKGERPMFESKQQERTRTMVTSPAVRQPAESAVRDQVTPAPRTVSFEPAKIDNFSFGAQRPPLIQTADAPLIKSAERPLSNLEESFRPNFAPRDDMNVSSLSFSTNHVLPAEKEKISEQGTGSREQGTGSKEQEIPNTIRQLTDQIPNAERPLPIPTAGASIKNETIAQSAPVKQAPAPPPVNRFRITPTGHRDTVASDDTPSPHVVDLRS